MSSQKTPPYIHPYTEGFIRGLTPNPLLTVSEWADKYRMLPSSSTEPGKYRTSRCPYLKDPMDCLSEHSPVRQVTAMKCTQIGWTELGNNWLMYIAHIAPGPCLMVLPTVDLARRHSKTKIAPSLARMEFLKDMVRDPSGRRSADSILHKDFPGGFWIFSGSNSPAGARSSSIKYEFFDDIDGFESDIGGEGDPIVLFRKRTDSFAATAKELCVSTPTEEGLSRIEMEFENSDQSEYYVPCPYCHKKQTLEWGGENLSYGIKWTRGDTSTAQYLCKFCGRLIPEGKKTWMLENGEWVAKYPDRSNYHRGFHLNSLYSPLGWVSWKMIIDEFLKVKNKSETLKSWVNTRLGKVFKLAGTQPDWVAIKTRAEPYHVLTVPQKALFMTAGVDVQENRISVLICAWGRGEECWVIWWGELYGLMDGESEAKFSQVWQELDELLLRGYPHQSGAYLHISCAAIDSGHKTQEVYNYVRHRSARTIAIKGMSTPGRPLIGRPSDQDIDYLGEVIKGGVQLWPIGTDTAKSLVYSRLVLTEPGSGMIHTPIGFDDDFYQQLTAEKNITRYDKQTGQPKRIWVLPSGRRNEVLDCMNYNFGAAIRVGLNHMDWAKLEKGLGEEIKRAHDPTKEEKRVPLAAKPKKVKRRKSHSSFMSNTTYRS